jgi:WD40 repeat protein
MLWEQKKKLYKWERGYGHACKIPLKLLFKLDTNKNGCTILKFSNNGKFLAVATINQEKKAILQLFSMVEEAKKASIGYHLGIVHEVKWSSNDKHIMACSSDCTAKIWKAKMLDEDYLYNDDQLSVATLKHPSFVYSCEFVKSLSLIDKTKLYIVTACHDAKIRFWFVDTQADQNSEDSQKLIHIILMPVNKEIEQTRFGCVFPNTLTIDDNSRMYCGDSNGCIHVWDIQIKETKIAVPFIKTIGEPEIIGDPINCVHISKLDKTKIIVHSRDNCLRLMESSSRRQKVRA